MKTAKTVYAVGFLKSLVMISRRHGVFLLCVTVSVLRGRRFGLR